ncbi:MAG: hypothetical protein ACOYBX_12715 [Mycobacterium sp.]
MAIRDAAGRRAADNTIQPTGDAAGALLPHGSDSGPPTEGSFAADARDFAGAAIATGALCWPAAACGFADRRDRDPVDEVAVPEAELAVDVSSAGPAHAAPA